MSWVKSGENLYTHDQAPFIIENLNGSWGIRDTRDKTSFIPFSDIFNNPVFPIDLSNADVIVKTLNSIGAIIGNSLTAIGVIAGNSLNIAGLIAGDSLSIVNASLSKHFRGEANNTPSTPAFSFQGDINSGFYRISEDKIGFSANGIRQGEFGVGYGGFTGNIIQVRSSIWNTQITTTSTILTGHKLSFTPLYSNSRLLFLLSGQIANNSGGTWGFLKIRNNTDGIYVNSSPRGVYNSAGSIYVNGLVMDVLTLSSLATKEYEIELSCSGNTGIYATYPATFIIMEIQT